MIKAFMFFTIVTKSLLLKMNRKKIQHFLQFTAEDSNMNMGYKMMEERHWRHLKICNSLL